MVVDDLNQAWPHVTLMPDETDAPQVVYPDTVLPLPVARQPLKAVARQSRKVCDIPGGIETLEPVFGLPSKGLKRLYPLSKSKALGARIPVAQDH
jgi:hypothetical protein